jgi:hypothetical protein
VDHLLDGDVDRETYAIKVRELDDERTTLELRLNELEQRASGTFLPVERLARLGAGAVFAFRNGPLQQQREVVASTLCNMMLRGQEVVSDQYQGPFGVLEPP